MEFKPDTTIVIETNTGDVTTEGQRIEYGLVLHRSLKSYTSYAITDPETSGLVTMGNTPDEAMENLQKIVETNGGLRFSEKLKEARDMHNRRKAAVEQAIEVLRPIVFEQDAVEQAIEVLRPIVFEQDATYVFEAIAWALFPNVRLDILKVPMPTNPSTTRH